MNLTNSHQPGPDSTGQKSGSGPSPRVLITAGPTWEPLDKVRYLGNRSSGRMGLAIAHAASEMGLQTTILRGPSTVCPEPFPHLSDVRFQTAEELQEELEARWPHHDILFMAAAVADFRPRLGQTPPEKIRRDKSSISIEFEPVPDLLAELSIIERPGQLRVGFALEPREELMNSARRKLRSKRLHAIVANPLETMDADWIDGRLITEEEVRNPPKQPMPKSDFACWLLEEALRMQAD